MILADLTHVKITDKIDIQCDKCGNIFTRTLKNHNQRKKRHGGSDICNTCSKSAGAAKRPQNSSEFLAKIRQSPEYYEGIANRPSIEGENNPNWGKTASAETRAKMSKSRTGKIGERATAWKGGKTSFNHRIKTALQRRYRWFHRVIDRDGCCTKRGANKQLDAHHIYPIAGIIKQITEDVIFHSDEDKFDYVINHPLIVDNDLTNGVCLCRSCHKLTHSNWGSHEPKIRE